MDSATISLPLLSEANFAGKTNLQEWRKYEKIHVVMGNEACDLDSAVSAYVYARFLASKVDDATVLVCPLLNALRNELKLKTEVTFLFGKMRIAIEDIPCRDDCPIEEIFAAGKLRLTLVDHNVLSHKDAKLDNSVVEVIDHHVLERVVNEHENITVEPVGSCCTLITEKILKQSSSFISPQLAALLHGTIILDTVNLSEAAKRVTPKDRDIIARLEAILGDRVNHQAIFDEILKAKEDVSLLSWDDLLCRDVKTIRNTSTQIAIASIPMLVQEYFQKYQDAHNNGLSGHCQKSGYDVLVVMGIQLANSVPKRDLAVYSRDVNFLHKIIDALKQGDSLSLNLQRINACPNPPSEFLVTFAQLNNTASRKVVLPLLKNFLMKNK